MNQKISEITATVPQGIGDIFWIYQKLIPHFEKIHFRVAILHDNEIERRALDVIAEFPGVASVDVRQIPYERYHPLMYGRYSLQDIIASGLTEFDYSLNYYLDNGIQLDDIDRLPVAYDIPLAMEPIEGIEPGYLLFFVSWATGVPETVEREKLWSVEQWSDLINMAAGYGLPIYLTGANFDRPVMERLKELCPFIHLVIQPKPKSLFWLIANCRVFVGYQSGLNVLAENLGRPQVHVFFDKLPLMRDSWCKPDRRHQFKICFFSDGIGKAFDQIGEILCQTK